MNGWWRASVLCHDLSHERKLRAYFTMASVIQTLFEGKIVSQSK
jgi:hypothetical protein